METWDKAQEWEKSWHGKCLNTYREETKQLVYAKKMGLEIDYGIDVKGKSILDIGGGCVSLLLKTRNLKNGTVIDPLEYPSWVYSRYASAKIETIVNKAENLDLEQKYDEVWIYNCLQHVVNPELIIQRAKKVCQTIRIFEWLNIPTNTGHIHELKKEKLDEWLGGKGNIEELNEYGCNGLAYFGVFKGDL